MNKLPVPTDATFTSETGIHWHGIELCSYSDGQPFTQNQTVPDPGGAIFLPPGSRVDVVIAIPDTAPAGVWTLWTHDFPRTGGGNANTATVPVMHLEVDLADGGHPSNRHGAARHRMRVAHNTATPNKLTMVATTCSSR
jgi:FtsP/CotA-like multicopper oxidase with cupredoxin domain